ncbi:hypothetical protein DFJ77DRAFT_113722 [Powellomyces hirtus]|nr:hypothetical protein DFJ77DRAFT_113722 [Powellomyces hirtus]
MIAVERSGSMNAKSPAVQLHFRKPPRKDSSPPFNYDARNDPALQHWFARPGIQKLVLPTELARPSLCARCNTPKESTCELCQTLFHDHIPPAPTLTLNPISTVIIHNSVSAPSLDSLTTLLTATGLFSNIQCMDVDQVVPTTEELQKYETILLIGNLLVPFSPKTLRNPPVPSWHKILRNHLSARQPGLVVTPTTFMSPLTPTMIHEALSPGLGRIDPEDHPMLAGVERLGMENSVWIVNGRAQKGAAVVARWGNGVPLVVVKGSLVAINMVVLPKYQSHHRLVDIWDPTHTDAVTLITNALRYVASLAEQQRRKTICDTCQTRPSSPGHNDWKTQRRVELEHAAKRRHRREIRYHEKVWAQYAESSRMKYHTPATPHQCELHEHGDGGPYDQHMSKPHQGGFLPQINVDSPYKRKSQPPTRQKADALPRFAQPEVYLICIGD